MDVVYCCCAGEGDVGGGDVCGEDVWGEMWVSRDGVRSRDDVESARVACRKLCDILVLPAMPSCALGSRAAARLWYVLDALESGPGFGSCLLARRQREQM